MQNDTTKEEVRKLVKEGRWEFVNGGWVATDEANPLYSDIIENIKVGHDFLWREFKVIPKVAWQADAFGHSSENAKIFMELGFEAFFFGRMNNKML